jgi:hypothetical protein
MPAIICLKGNGLATLVGARDHGLKLFDFSNPFPLENGGTSHPLLLLPRPLSPGLPSPPRQPATTPAGIIIRSTPINAV